MSKQDARWLTLVLLVVGLVVVAHAWIVAAHSSRTAGLGRADLSISLPYQLIRPEFTVDGHMWIRYAVALTEGRSLQLRRTLIDNAPAGREVHWNSGYAWWIAGWGWVWHKATGLPLTQATERAAMWINAPLLFAAAAIFGWWTMRRAGLAAGIIVALGLVGHRSLYEGFWPGYADHHGITLASILGFGLGVFFMRGGWVDGARGESEEGALRAARWAGFWGGVALWISAASAIPAIAFATLSAVLGNGVVRRARDGAVYVPRIWQTWGRTGALTSGAFYLLEYFPSHLGFRMEVNHPLYALAWLAGAELLARVMPWLTWSGPRPEWRAVARTAAWALPLIVAPPVVILAGGSKVFLPSDPFMVGLHRTITEFLPLWLRLPMEGFRSHYDALLLMPGLYLLGVLACFVRRADRWALVFALGSAVPLHLMGFWQSRWAMSAAPGQVLLVVALAGVLPHLGWLAAAAWRRRAALALLLAYFYGPATWFRAREAHVFATVNGITAGDGRQLVYREVAQMIRESQPEGEVVLFGSPNTSVNVAFYGDFRTLGTLYWENLDGLKAAAQISSARTDEEAAELIRRHGVTHLAFFRDGNYILEFALLLQPGITEQEAMQTFGYRLMGSRMVPVWLEALPYAAPEGLPAGVDKEVLVFKVNFDQKPTEAAYRLGALQMRRMELADALGSFELAIRLDQANYPAALRRAEIFVQQEKWAEAVGNFDLAVQLAPAAERYRLLTQTAIAFATVKQRGLAIPYYERALQEQVTNVIAPNNLAWILATIPDPELRDPARSLALARACAAQLPDNSSVLGTLAAALAANEDYAAAVSTLEQAIMIARKGGNEAALAQMLERLDAYRQGRPWFEP